MRQKQAQYQHGFTLLELLVSVVLMGVIGSVLLPVVSSASDSYTTTREVRNATERMAFALDRMSRMVRQAPIGADDEGVGIRMATASSIEFTDGSGFRLESNQILMLVPGGSPVLLCDDIDQLQITLIGADGVTSTVASPQNTHRVVVMAQTGSLRMSVVAHPRVWIGQGGGS